MRFAVLISAVMLVASAGQAAAQDTLFFDDFDDGVLDGWLADTTWYIESGELVGYVDYCGTSVYAFAGADTWRNYAFECDFMPTDGVHSGFHFRQKILAGTGYAINVRTDKPNPPDDVVFTRRSCLQGECSTTVCSEEFESQLNQWYHIRIEVQDNQTAAFIDGEHILTCQDDHYTEGQIGLKLHCAYEPWYNGMRVDNVLVTSLGPLPPPDTLSISDGTGQIGSSSNPVTVSLWNDEYVKGVQFTVNDVPDSLTVDSVAVTDRAAGMGVFYNESGGDLNVIITSTAGSMIESGDGPIAEIGYSVGVVNPDNCVELRLTDVSVADSLNAPITTVAQNGEFCVTGTKGDVDGDEDIDLFDALRIIDIAIGAPPPPTEYEQWAGDMNDDGEIDLFDVLDAIDMVLYGKIALIASDGTWMTSALSLGHAAEGAYGVRGDLAEVARGLYATIDVGSAQVDDIWLSSMAEGLTLASQVVNGKLRVMIVGLDGGTLKAGEGTIFEFKLSSEAVEPKIVDATLASMSNTKLPLRIEGARSTEKEMPVLWSAAHPNPFAGNVMISYALGGRGARDVELAVYDLTGRLVARLVDDRLPSGTHSVMWDGKDEAGEDLSSGVYFYKLKSGRESVTRKLLLTR